MHAGFDTNPEALTEQLQRMKQNYEGFRIAPKTDKRVQSAMLCDIDDSVLNCWNITIIGPLRIRQLLMRLVLLDGSGWRAPAYEK